MMAWSTLYLEALIYWIEDDLHQEDWDDRVGAMLRYSRH